VKLNLSLVLRAGLLGALAAVILHLAGRFVPGLGGGGALTLGLDALVALFTGVYYAYHSRKGDWLTNIIGGGLAGGLMALIAALVGALLPVGGPGGGAILPSVVSGLIAGAVGGLVLSIIRRV
jgi:hypothetical protein